MDLTSHPVPPYSVSILPSHLRLGFRSEAAKIIVVRKLERKRQPGRPRRVWDHDVGMEIKGWEGANWIEFGCAGGQVAGSFDYGNEPSVFVKYGKIAESLAASQAGFHSTEADLNFPNFPFPVCCAAQNLPCVSHPSLLCQSFPLHFH
jgi:hypothetical protein